MRVKPYVGGVVGTLLAASGILVAGGVSGAEAHILLEAILPSARFLCSSVMTASATILALLLTGLGFARGVDVELKPETYDGMRRMAFVDSIALIGSVMVLLMLLNVPIQQTEAVPANWHSALYYIVIGANAVLGGLLISIVLMLYETIRDLTLLVGEGTSPLRKREESEESEKREESEQDAQQS